MMLYIKVFLQFLFYLIGTFLHEFAHFALAKMTFSQTPSSVEIEEEDENGKKYKKRVPGFTIVPKIHKTSVTYGHVFSIPRYQAAFVLIASAPLIWLYVLYLFLNYYSLLYIEFNDGFIVFNLDYQRLLNIHNWWIVYISLQFIWAGTLSSQDIKVLFKGILSLSFLVIFSLLLVIYDFSHQHQLIYFLEELLR